MSPDRLSSFSRRSILRLGAGISVGALAGYYINQARMSSPQPIWKYDSYPPHFLHWDVGFRTATAPIMEVVADGIIAHFFDWTNINLTDKTNGVILPGDPSAMPRRNFWESVKADSKVGWQQVYSIGVNPNVPVEDKFWQVAFRIDDRTVSKCRILIPITERVAVLVGRENGTFYALSPDNLTLPAIHSGPFSRHQVGALGARPV